MSATAIAEPIGVVDSMGYGDFTRERHERPERPLADIIADIMQDQVAHPERLTINPVTRVEA
ncbi:MAG: hypothetical protein LBB74_04250 [Chitinispirillales bacterium]|jgi:hypothetical protein|nr:hypothetical protein [Chitinispirillales bacterium]